jgi:erythronate-4-phosphate dehydrogenase
VDAAWVATPHIAGYTVEGKRRATAAIHLALAQHLGVAPTFFSTDAMPPQAAGDAAARAQLEADDRALRAWTAAHAHDRDARARAFEAYRSTYAFRRER